MSNWWPATPACAARESLSSTNQSLMSSIQDLKKLKFSKAVYCFIRVLLGLPSKINHLNCVIFKLICSWPGKKSHLMLLPKERFPKLWDINVWKYVHMWTCVCVNVLYKKLKQKYFWSSTFVRWWMQLIVCSVHIKYVVLCF